MCLAPWNQLGGRLGKKGTAGRPFEHLSCQELLEAYLAHCNGCDPDLLTPKCPWRLELVQFHIRLVNPEAGRHRLDATEEQREQAPPARSVHNPLTS